MSKTDSLEIQMADLPVNLDSTSYLLHPIGEFQLRDKRGGIVFKSSGYGSNKFTVSNSGGYGITGNLSNILFQHISSEKLTPLTNKNMKIQSASFLWEFHNKTNKGILVYEINDSDSNNDGYINSNDIKSLYLSKIDGSGFKKLTQTNNELIQWKFISIKDRLYFKTIKDSNKNGEFEETDKVFYKYVNLDSPDFEIMEYNPI
jgi:hypothetical protein